MSPNGHGKPEYTTKKVKVIYSKMKVSPLVEMTVDDYFSSFGL